MLRKTQPMSLPWSIPDDLHEFPESLAESFDDICSLICGVCGTVGRYHVGTVVFDSSMAKPRDPEDLDQAVGFKAYFRCRKCNSGGPWELTDATRVRVLAWAVLAVAGIDEVPLIFGCSSTFDKHTFRYPTEAEAHLKGLIDDEPERAFLWVRLGNLYHHAGRGDVAENAYKRALELDPKDIEAHNMLGEALSETSRPLDAVPHWHAVLKYAREASHVSIELRRILVREAIECLLQAYHESGGKIELFPTVDPSELGNPKTDEPLILELQNYDLSIEEDMEALCEIFVGRDRRSRVGRPFRRRRRSRPAPQDDPAHRLIRDEPRIGRNDPCPCGSGRKNKKCCGR